MEVENEMGNKSKSIVEKFLSYFLALSIATSPFVAPRIASCKEKPYPPHKIELKKGNSLYSYKEPGIMEIKGKMESFGLSYNYEPKKKGWTAGVNGSYAIGKLDYTSEKTGSMDNRKNTIKEIEPKLGYKIPFGESSTFTPYIGIGYRKLEDKASGRTCSVKDKTYHGYDRKNESCSAIFGAKIKTETNSGWVYGIDLKAKLLVRGKQISSFNDFDPTYPQVTNIQREGGGLKASAKIGKKTKLGTFFIEPYFEVLMVKCSKPAYATIRMGDKSVNPVYEPGNRTYMGGVNLALEF